MEPFSIESAQEGDFPSLATMALTYIGNHWSQDAFLRKIQSEQYLLLVARTVLKSQIIGYIEIELVPPEANLLEIAVVPGWRKQGVGREILTHALDLLHAESINKFLLEVDKRNTPAIDFYTNAGFTWTGERKNYYDGVYPALLGEYSILRLQALKYV